MRGVVEISNETYSGVKKERKVKDPLDLLHDVMYGNEYDGTASQAYEDLKNYLKTPNAYDVCMVLKAHTGHDWVYSGNDHSFFTLKVTVFTI